MYETIKQAGYKYVNYSRTMKAHYLFNKDTDLIEVFVANKYHASWGLIYKNTHLEFCCTLPKKSSN